MVIKNNVKNEIVINKSKFITFLYKIKTKEDFLFYLETLKKEYKDATHICYAYIINQEIKFNDDKEPNGSAGLPIYEVLKKNNLNNIACFVIRYFGGIKLGGSGLIRAYSNSVSLCLKKTEIIEYQETFIIKVSVPYSKISVIENKIQKDNLLKKEYNDTIDYTLAVSKDKLEILKEYQIPYTIIKTDSL